MRQLEEMMSGLLLKCAAIIRDFSNFSGLCSSCYRSGGIGEVAESLNAGEIQKEPWLMYWQAEVR